MRRWLSPPVRKAVDWVVGLTLITIGVIAGPIPVLQGWVFVLAGLAVLSSHSRWARAIYDRVRKVGRGVRNRVRRRRDDEHETTPAADGDSPPP